jgi:uncharacterized phage protein (TIGR01671 family)
MRPFEFRAWHKGSVRGSDGKLLSSPQMIYETVHPGDVFRWLAEGQDLEIMQFTGLLDRKGVKIWEGDIIDGMIVTFCGDQQEGLGMHVGWYLQRDNFESWVELESRCNNNGDNYEVIGNVWENPSLLDVQS